MEVLRQLGWSACLARRRSTLRLAGPSTMFWIQILDGFYVGALNALFDYHRPSCQQFMCSIPFHALWSQNTPTEAWLRHAEASGLTTGNCKWSQVLGDYVKANWSAKYKTAQMFDLSKRVYNYLDRDLGREHLDKFAKYFGEMTDFQNADLHSLAALQNMHCFGKLVCCNLLQSYPKPLLAALYMQGCRFFASSLNSLDTCV